MITPELLNYVKQQLLQGMSKEMIKNDLLNRGWTAPDLDQAIVQAESAPSLSTPTPTSSLEGSIVPDQAPNTPNHALTWITGVTVVVLLGLGGWYAYLKFFNKPTTELAGNQSQAQGLSPLLNPSQFVGAYDDYKIYVPKNWQLKEEGDTKLQTASFYDPAVGENLCRLSVSRGPELGGRTFDQLVATIKESLDGTKITKENDIMVNGIPFHTIEANYTKEGMSIVNRVQMTIYKGVYFSVGYKCTVDEADKNQKALEAAINTFIIIPDAIPTPKQPIPEATTTPNTVTVDNRLEQTAYLDKVKSYQINLPKDWQIDSSAVPSSNGFGAAPKNAKQYNGLPLPNLGLLIEPANGESLDEILTFIIKNDPSHPTITAKQSVKVSGYDAISLETTGIEQGNKLKAKFLLVIKGGQIYLIGGTALDSTWNEYKDLISVALSTFQLQ